MDEYSLIETIRTRPGMYLGTLGITALMNFMHGYQFALRERGERSADNLFPLDFYFMHEYTALLYGLYESTAGWRNHILWNCGGDEEKALFKFFELFDEFKAIRSEKCWRVSLSAENLAFNKAMENAFSEPLFVYIVKLTIPAFLLVVETESEVCVKSVFHRSIEEAAQTGAHFSRGAEGYFGKLGEWTEVGGFDGSFNGKAVKIQ